MVFFHFFFFSVVPVSFLGAQGEGLASSYLELPFLDTERQYLLFVSSPTSFSILSKIITEGSGP